MFDWNDEELANIVWGEAGDSDDHIVPYRRENEDSVNKDLNQDSVRQSGKSTHGTEHKIHGRKLDSDSNFNANEGMVGSGFSVDSWCESSLSNGTKSGQTCVGAEVAKDVNGTAKFCSSEGTSELVNNPKVFEIPEKSREQGDFVVDGWANIGSFDDFDRVFSNDDQIFGNVNIRNNDELWPSSKGVSDIPLKAVPISLGDPDLELGTLRNTSEDMGLVIKTEYMQDDKSCTIGCEDRNDLAYHGSHNSNETTGHAEYVEGRSNPILKQIGSGVAEKAVLEKPHLTSQNGVTTNEFADKTYRPRKLLKSKKSAERSAGYSSWSSRENMAEQFNQLAPAVVQSHNSSIFSQQRQLQGPESLHHQNTINHFLPTSVYGNLAHPYSTMSMSSYMQSMDLKLQPLPYGNEAPLVNAISSNKSADTFLKHQTMTPQEKIEKLRRKQQMQAMLAIKKQQQQFNHQTSADNITPSCSRDNQTHHVEGADLEVEDHINLPSLDPSSTIDHVDSNAISVAVDGYSCEEIALNQLQDTVAKLDMRIRLCIRDSLFRLGQSVVQRLHAIDTNNTSKSRRDEHEPFGKQDISNTNRYAKMPDAETETNHIDRTVAHLLFHRNLEISESPGPTKIPYSLADPQHVDQFKTKHHLEVSENASVSGPAGGEAKEVQASQ